MPGQRTAKVCSIPIPSPSASWMFILASMHVTTACSTIAQSEGRTIKRADRLPPVESTCLIRAQLSIWCDRQHVFARRTGNDR